MPRPTQMRIRPDLLDRMDKVAAERDMTRTAAFHEAAEFWLRHVTREDGTPRKAAAEILTAHSGGHATGLRPDSYQCPICKAINVTGRCPQHPHRKQEKLS